MCDVAHAIGGLSFMLAFIQLTPSLIKSLQTRPLMWVLLCQRLYGENGGGVRGPTVSCAVAVNTFAQMGLINFALQPSRPITGSLTLSWYVVCLFRDPQRFTQGYTNAKLMTKCWCGLIGNLSEPLLECEKWKIRNNYWNNGFGTLAQYFQIIYYCTYLYSLKQDIFFFKRIVLIIKVVNYPQILLLQ